MSPADAAILLGVAPGASAPEIQHAFARQARLHHPDLMTDASEEERHAAGIRFAELRAARDLLLATAPPAIATAVGEDPYPWPVRTTRTEPMRGPWSTVLVFLLLAVLVVTVVTIQDGFRSEFVQNLRGVTVEIPAAP
jgi:hypothetical protein